MKVKKFVFITIIILVMLGVISGYVYIGTYIFPIAPYWVTQLPPNPPKPKVKSGEFKFKIIYSINHEIKEVSDIIVCEFKGFEVQAIGDTKKRVWSENLKNENSYELFSFREDDKKTNERTYSAICIENIEDNKVILQLAEAEWFLGEDDYVGNPQMPIIQVYDSNTQYYLNKPQRDAFLKEHNFEIVEWICDNPINNEFN